MDGKIKEMEQALKEKKGQLEAQGEELRARNPQQEEPTTEEADSRESIAAQAEQLNAMQQELQQRGEKLQRQNAAGAAGVNINAAAEPRKKVDEKTISEFEDIRQRYQDGKKDIDERIINNQNWWCLRNFGTMNPKEGTAAAADKSQKADNRPRSVTSWGINAVINKHADYMDNYPEPIFLPMEASDEEAATMLTSVVPAIFEKAGFHKTYSNLMWQKVIEGTDVTSVYWDSSQLNGLGDIGIKKCNVLNLAWDPEVTDIQDSEYFFETQVFANSKIKNMFPHIKELEMHLGQSNNMPMEYRLKNHDKDTTERSCIVDVYYHRLNSEGKSVLHYCKYVNDLVLFASENEEEYAETGFYKHGRYPYEFDVMFPMQDSPCGFGYYDVMKDVLKDIDEFTDNFNHRAKTDSHPRAVYNKNCGIDAKQLADVTQEFVESDGTLDESNFRQIQNEPLPAIYINYYMERINELKEVSNNRDVASGGTTSGATAASAIASMQEAASKTSRDQEASSYESFKNVCYLVLELIAEFYDEKRTFRITGDTGEAKYVEFDNSGVKETVSKNADGQETARKPIYDIKVKPQKRSAYSTLAHNELMVQLWSMGIFDPQMATQASVFLQNMEFEGKDKLLSQVSKNGTIFQQLQQYQQIVMQLAQQVDLLRGTNETSLQVQAALEQGQIPMAGGAAVPANAAAGQNSTIADRAREQTRSRAEVR